MTEFPLPKFHFEVRWGDKLTGEFAEVSGLDAEPEAIEYQVGTIGEYTKFKMKGMKDFGRIILKRGTFEGGHVFLDYFKTTKLNKFTRETLRISLLNENHEAMISWEAHNAWPIKIQTEGFNSEISEVTIESIEFVHEGFEILK